jgi:hypothetical protein
MKQITLKLTDEQWEVLQQLRLEYIKQNDKHITMTAFIKMELGLE